MTLLLLTLGFHAAAAQDAATVTASPQDEIAGQLGQLATAFNSGDVDAMLTAFLPNAELRDEAGTIHQGETQLRELFGGFFELFPGASVRMELESVGSITPQLAVADVVRQITTADGAERAITRSAMTLVLQDGKWLIAAARDSRADAELSPNQQLESLAWMVGDWVDEGAESLIEIHCDWSEDTNYLLLEYKITQEGEVVLKSHERLGWDPVQEQIRSWVFDTDGGFGGGLWTKIDDVWVVKRTAVFPDGATGSATFVIEPQGEDRFVTRGFDRLVGDAIEPDIEATVVRRPPHSN
jgi:uncharacterized protein (TIGR02246 family)